MQVSWTDFLDRCAWFVYEHYKPWESLSVEDIAAWLMPSYLDGTLVPFIVGPEMIALYEYWLITDEYLLKLEAAQGNELPLPSREERHGKIPFFPVTVIHQNYVGKGYGITRIATEVAIKTLFPDADGLYRWVLKGNRLGYLPFRRK